MIQAKWNGLTWEIAANRLTPLGSIATTLAVKKETDKTKGTATIQGMELQTFSFRYKVTQEGGIDPRKEYEQWEKQLGLYAPLYVGGLRFGPKNIQLQKVDMSDFTLDAMGNFRQGTIKLDFTEYADQNSKGDMQIIYKGADIYPNISVTQCVHDMYGESQADSLVLKFNDTTRKWDEWNNEKPKEDNLLGMAKALAKKGIELASVINKIKYAVTTGIKDGLKADTMLTNLVQQAKADPNGASTKALAATIFGANAADAMLEAIKKGAVTVDNLKATLSYKNSDCPEEIITVIEGTATTGKMFVYDIKPENGGYTLKAFSIPPTAKNKTSKSWNKVKFEQLAREIATRHGLEFTAYNIPDVTYNYVCQDNMPDFVFLETRCKLEGCAFLVYDGKLVIYSEHAQEGQTPQTTLTLDTTAQFTYSNTANKSYKKAEVVNGSITGTYTAPSGTGSQTLHKDINIPMTSIGEANRFAKSLLRLNNKQQNTGTINEDIQRNLAAGSVIALKTAGVTSWDGSVFIYHIRHDYCSLKSKIWVRKPLGY